ncbi:hypothetical protein ACQP2T_20250 [Nonomuraea sp. CA-143628]|uniref:hypothetical protein n=1 Tax=Nonomuraea sp. CA-143628 TaxID=3239997 RepID=UPI003D930E13
MSSPPHDALVNMSAPAEWPAYRRFARVHFSRGKAEGMIEGRTEGKAEEAARSVLLVLGARDFNVPDDIRAQITTCTDLAQLETWLTDAATTQTLQDLFMKSASATWPVYSPFAREHFGRGKAEGRAEAKAEARAEEAARSVLLVLGARDFNVPDDIHAQITTCTDLAQLETWLTDAATTQTLQDLFMKSASATWPVYSPFAREHFGRGKAEGRAEAKAEARAEEAARSVLLVLGARDFNVPDDIHAQITTCTDLAQLETWLTRAATAQTLQDLFAENESD